MLFEKENIVGSYQSQTAKFTLVLESWQLKARMG